MPDEKKEPTKQELAEQDRKNIKVTEPEKVEDEVEETTEEETVNDEIKEEVKEETKEEPAAKTEDELKAEKAEATTVAEKARIQRRIDKEVAKRKAVEDENKTLKAQLAAKPEGEKVLTEADVDARANQKLLEKEFVDNCNKLAKAATKLDPKFKEKIDELAADIGKIPGEMIGILSDLDNGAEVLSHLTNNPDEAEEIWTLPLAKMVQRLDRLSMKLEDAVKPKPKEISKVPAPIEGGAGNSTVKNLDPSKAKSTAEYVEIRNKQVAERQARKMAGMRN